MNPLSCIDRRQFVKMFAVATAYSSLQGKAWKTLVAGEVGLESAPATTGLLRLKLSDFPALLTESGSVRIGINGLRGSPPSGPTPDGQFYPILVNRGPNNAFFALNTRCTHQGCAVDPMDASSNEISCPCHGSVYAIDGKRISGPASSGLTKYAGVLFDGVDTVSIQVPGLNYTVTPARAQGVANSRVQLDFRSFRKVDYEVQFRETLDPAALAKPAPPVSFATSAAGPLDQTVFSAATAANVSLFVEPSTATGFYIVAAKVFEL